jgi:antitoxin (DNA-binding transcriptional repressor) of toxin-antitoxin stability system
MIFVEVSQAQTDLPRLLEEVARGQTVHICKDNVPIAELRPTTLAPPLPPGQKRPVGLAEGQGVILPSFYEPLPEDLLKAFNGETS